MKTVSAVSTIQATITPVDVFNKPGLESLLGLKANTIPREILLGRLKAYRRGRQTFFLGSDVLEWIRGGLVKPEDELDNDED